MVDSERIRIAIATNAIASRRLMDDQSIAGSRSLHSMLAEIMQAADRRAEGSRNEARDRWLYERRKAGVTWENLQSELGEKKNFDYLSSTTGMRDAIQRYCKAHNLRYPAGKPGRPSGSSKPTKPKS